MFSNAGFLLSRLVLFSCQFIRFNPKNRYAGFLFRLSSLLHNIVAQNRSSASKSRHHSSQNNRSTLDPLRSTQFFIKKSLLKCLHRRFCWLNYLLFDLYISTLIRLVLVVSQCARGLKDVGLVARDGTFYDRKDRPSFAKHKQDEPLEWHNAMVLIIIFSPESHYSSDETPKLILDELIALACNEYLLEFCLIPIHRNTRPHWYYFIEGFSYPAHIRSQ